MESPLPDIDGLPSADSATDRSHEIQAGFDSEDQSSVELEIPPFAARCRQACRSQWEASFDHPFVKGLIDGTLPGERFRFYQMQDARYLEAFADACSIVSTRFTAPDDKLWFIEGARLAIVVERQLHDEYGKVLGYTPQDIATLELSPSNRAYQDHLLTCARQGSLLEAVGALTPCPWLYTDIGIRILKELGHIPDSHPYRDWLRTYADPSFVTYSNEMMAILERLAKSHGSEHRERSVDAFRTSTRYEWMFWDQAWEMQQWPV